MNRCVYVVFDVAPYPPSGRCFQTAHAAIVGSSGSSLCVSCAEAALRSSSPAEACAVLDAVIYIVPRIGVDADLLETCGRLLVTSVANCAGLTSYQPYAALISSFLLALLAHVAADERQSSDLLQALLCACQELASTSSAGSVACLALLSDCVGQSAVFATFAVRGSSSIMPLISYLLRSDPAPPGGGDDSVAEDALYLLLQLLVHAADDPDGVDLFLNAFAEADVLPAIVELLSPSRDCSDGATNNGLALIKVLSSVHAAAALIQHYAAVVCTAVLPKLIHNKRNDFVVAAADIITLLAGSVSVPASTVDITLESLRTANDVTAPAVARLLLATAHHIEPTRAVLSLVLRLQDVSDEAFADVANSPLLHALVKACGGDALCVNDVAAAAARASHSISVFLALLVALATHVDDAHVLSHDQAVLVAHILLDPSHRPFFLQHCSETLLVAAFLSCRTDMIRPIAADCLLASLTHKHHAASHGMLLAAVRRIPAATVRDLVDVSLVVRCLILSPFAATQHVLTLQVVAPLVDWAPPSGTTLAWVPHNWTDEASLWAAVAQNDVGSDLIPRAMCSLALRGCQPPLDRNICASVLDAIHLADKLALHRFLEIATAVSIWWPELLPHTLTLCPSHCPTEVAAFVHSWCDIEQHSLLAAADIILSCYEHAADSVICELCVDLIAVPPLVPDHFVKTVAASPLGGMICAECVKRVRRRFPDRNARLWYFVSAALRLPSLTSNVKAMELMYDAVLSFVLGKAADMPSGDAACHLDVVHGTLAADVEHRFTAGDVALSRWACSLVGSFAGAWKVLYLLFQRPYASELRRKITLHDEPDRSLVAAMYSWAVQVELRPSDSLLSERLLQLVEKVAGDGDAAQTAVLLALLANKLSLTLATQLGPSDTHWLFDVLCDVTVTAPPRTLYPVVICMSRIAASFPEVVDSMGALGALLNSLAPTSAFPHHVTAQLLHLVLDPRRSGTAKPPPWWRGSIDESLQLFLDRILQPEHTQAHEVIFALGKLLSSAPNRSYRCSRIADFIVCPPTTSPPWTVSEDIDGAACIVTMISPLSQL